MIGCAKFEAQTITLDIVDIMPPATYKNARRTADLSFTEQQQNVDKKEQKNF